MDTYVVNRTGVPVRITLIRLDEAPDLYALIVTPDRDTPDDIRGKRVLDRVARDHREGIRLPGVVTGTTLRYTDRLNARTRVTHDGDGDKLIIIESLWN